MEAGTNSRVVTLSVLLLLGLALCSASRSLQGSHETSGAGGSGIYTKQGFDVGVGVNASVGVHGTNVLGPIIQPIIDHITNLKPILSPIIKSPPIAPIVAPIAEPIVAPVSEPIVAPIAEPIVAPVSEPVVAPVISHVTAPIASIAGEPIAV